MFHRSETVYDIAGNPIVRHYQKDLAGNWVLVATITSSFNVGAEEFKNGIEKNRKRKRTNLIKN
jgi:hypothetical protein